MSPDPITGCPNSVELPCYKLRNGVKRPNSSLKDVDIGTQKEEGMQRRRIAFTLLAVGLVGVLLATLGGCSSLLSPTNSSGSFADQDQLGILAKGFNVWHVPGDFPTIQAAIDSDAVKPGDRIMVGPGLHTGAEVDKAVEIRGTDGATINAGPAHSSGLSQGFRLIAGSGGCTISHLTFTTDFSIMNGAAVDNVTVSQCTFVDSIQAVTNWSGSGWMISHNVITDLRTKGGGGIGIFVGDYSGGTVKDNVISHNTIQGTLHVDSNDGGGYNGSGIVLYADFRWGRLGATGISQNRVVNNKVSMSSDTPDIVDIIAIELTESRDIPDPYLRVIFDNSIGFNDLRDTELQIVLTPDALDECNDISRNLGENRGHGLHPSVFGPGGN